MCRRSEDSGEQDRWGPLLVRREAERGRCGQGHRCDAEARPDSNLGWSGKASQRRGPLLRDLKGALGLARSCWERPQRLFQVIAGTAYAEA